MNVMTTRAIANFNNATAIIIETQAETQPDASSAIGLLNQARVTGFDVMPKLDARRWLSDRLKDGYEAFRFARAVGRFIRASERHVMNDDCQVLFDSELKRRPLKMPGDPGSLFRQVVKYSRPRTFVLDEGAPTIEQARRRRTKTVADLDKILKQYASWTRTSTFDQRSRLELA